jgi:intracellular sulfur oxidation DsrE/DsrF family protein
VLIVLRIITLGEERMKAESRHEGIARRGFLSRLTAAAAAFGAALGSASGVQAAQAPAAAPGSWRPARHPEDDWYDDTSAKHRFFMDTTTAEGLRSAMGFARNFFTASASGYKLTDADSAQIICLRHHSTSFAFNDAMWARYGEALSTRADYVDPKTTRPPAVNPYDHESDDDRGVTLSALAKRGVRYAVCSMATRRAATLIAQKTGAKVDDVFAELTRNLVPNAHMVPAGIVAVNRAQEHGYAATTVV